MAQFPGIYTPRYSDSIAELIARQGDIAARGAEQKGALWSQAINQLGQIGAGAVQAHQEQKAQSKRDAALMEFVNSGSWAESPEAAVRGSVAILGPSGVKFAEGLIGVAKLREARSPEDIQKTLPSVARGFLAAPDQLKAQLWTPLRGMLEQTGAVEKGALPDFTPELLPMIQAYAGPEKPEGAIVETVGPDGKPIRRRVSETELTQGVPVYVKPEAEKHTQTLAEKVAEATALAEARAKVEQKYAGAKESKEDTKKAEQFKSAVPVINAVSELSERINTLQGVAAKASGEIEKQKAKLNLNDNVAEYESLVMGFTPLVARALGHTGVLTEQDVQSVRTLFPRPEDSKSLRDRKVARLRGIMLQMPGIDPKAFDVAPPQTPTQSTWTEMVGGKIRELP